MYPVKAQPSLFNLFFIWRALQSALHVVTVFMTTVKPPQQSLTGPFQGEITTLSVSNQT